MRSRPIWLTRIGLATGIILCLFGSSMLAVNGWGSSIGRICLASSWLVLLAYLVYFLTTPNLLSLAVWMPARSRNDEFEYHLAYKALARSFFVVVLLVGIITGVHLNDFLLTDYTEPEALGNASRSLILGLFFIGYSAMALPGLILAWSIKPLDLDDEEDEGR